VIELLFCAVDACIFVRVDLFCCDYFWTIALFCPDYSVRVPARYFLTSDFFCSCELFDM
jgi:hypothetical protein